MKRVERIVYKRAWLISGLLSFLLLVGLSFGTRPQDVEGDYGGDGIADDTGQNYAEVFSAGDSNSGIVYINFQEPQATNDFSCPAWFLAAYRFNDNDHSLVVELARGGSNGLTNNLRYAIHFEGRAGQPVPPSNSVEQPSLYLNLLGTNGVVLAASDNLLTSSNVAHYVIPVPMDIGINSSGIQSNATVLLVNVPTAEYPDAAVIQLMAGDGGTASTMVYEGLLYIDEDGDFLTAEFERRNSTSDYSYDGNASISNYYDWLNGGGSSTNLPDGNGGGSSTNNPGGGPGAATGFIYVSQSIGLDVLTGRAPEVRGNDGPKKTISQGLAAVDDDGAHTLVIKSGDYGEDLDLRPRRVTVVIEGNVKL